MTVYKSSKNKGRQQQIKTRKIRDKENVKINLLKIKLKWKIRKSS